MRRLSPRFVAPIPLPALGGRSHVHLVAIVDVWAANTGVASSICHYLGGSQALDLSNDRELGREMTGNEELSPDTDTVEELRGEQVAADAVDLQASLGELASLVIGGERLSDLLAHVATFAVRAIPGAEVPGDAAEGGSLRQHGSGPGGESPVRC